MTVNAITDTKKGEQGLRLSSYTTLDSLLSGDNWVG